MKKWILHLSLLLSISGLYAQQQINFSQYMYDLSTLNPGHMGIYRDFSASIFSRWQWSGVDGAPNTQTLVLHSPVNIDNVSLGLQLIRDEIGVTSNSYLLPAAGYKIKAGLGFLSMGLQGGIQLLNNRLQDAYVLPSSQSEFSENFTRVLPVVGYGFYYQRRNFYLGFSSPFALKTSVEVDGGGRYTQRQHFYLTSGISLPINEDIRVKPNLLVRAVSGTPVSADYNVNFLYKELFWIGFSYRPESISVLLDLKVHKNFRFGYAYDHVIAPSLNEITTSSHEIMINYNLGVIIEKYD
ncbi:MAG: type IX secretion system membrane protein PorP/SprF [Bacteroidota bacterium]